MSGPSRRDCPAGATPVNPPPIPLWEVPDGFDPALQTVLTGLPAAVIENDVLAALARSMPAPRSFNPDTQTADRAPLRDVALRGDDVGVAYRAGDRSTGGIDCLLGSRVNGTTLVWRPSWAQVQPANSRAWGRPRSTGRESPRRTSARRRCR
ncbi:hypothetical protein ACFVYA_35355 [Amycolatopsis sp. NPDC058278]|uniref:hypothetical protein n=1 Tax=Amycolatopsis sp. NPDC058278 TaxID=3346417 RepID=UPI0036D89DCD